MVKLNGTVEYKYTGETPVADLTNESVSFNVVNSDKVVAVGEVSVHETQYVIKLVGIGDTVEEYRC